MAGVVASFRSRVAVGRVTSSRRRRVVVASWSALRRLMHRCCRLSSVARELVVVAWLTGRRVA
ncbi:hypothetical protein ACXZ9C_11740 [Streptococcus agalactiae]